MIDIKKHRFEYLDGIRGVAAVLVVINHFRHAFVIENINSVFYNFLFNRFNYFFLNANFSVKIFFILSGFVLAYNSFNKPGFLNKQILKRFYRLFVPILITSILYYLASSLGLIIINDLCKVQISNWVCKLYIYQFDIMSFIKELICYLFIANEQFSKNINASLWTLPVELYWSYLLFIIYWPINLIQKNIYKNLTLITYSIIMLLFYKFIGFEFGVLFLIGTLFALNFEFITNFYNTKIFNLVLILFVLIISYLVERKWILNFNDNILNRTNIMAMLFILIAIRSQFIQYIFSNTIFNWLGKVSFSLYLLHMLVIITVSTFLYLKFSFFTNNIGLLLLLIFTMFISFLISYLFTKYVDEPIMKQFDKYYKKYINGTK